MAQNHYPLIGRKAPPSCQASAQDTANPFTPPTCPKCIARLEAKVAAEDVATITSRSKQERQLHASTARMYREILSGTHQIAA